MKPRRSMLQETGRPLNWRRAVAITLKELRLAGMLRGSTAVLIGSYAHGAQRPTSDIDILLLVSGECRKRSIAVPPAIHIQCQDARTFRDRADQGDDYAISALRFGRALYAPTGRWRQFRQLFSEGRWPRWPEKITYGARRVRVGQALLSAGDTDAAAEEFLLAATQIGRAVLLRRGVYPLSRPQLENQLREAGELHLAEIIGVLQSPELNETQLRQIGGKLDEASDRGREADRR